MTVSPVVEKAIRELLLSIPSYWQMPDESKIGLVRQYAAKVASFPEPVSIRALDRLITTNPRNPFPPTTLDVVEECLKVERLEKARSGADDLLLSLEKARKRDEQMGLRRRREN